MGKAELEPAGVRVEHPRKGRFIIVIGAPTTIAGLKLQSSKRPDEPDRKV